MPTTDSTEARLAARRDALRAARATKAPTHATDVTTCAVADLRVGDWLVSVPTQDGTRGVRYCATVTDLQPVNAGTQRLELRGTTVRVHASRGGIAVRTGGGQVTVGTLVWPPYFTAKVRRALVAEPTSWQL